MGCLDYLALTYRVISLPAPLNPRFLDLAPSHDYFLGENQQNVGLLSASQHHYQNYRPRHPIALNALTLLMSDALKDDNVLVNAMCPGLVATDMGGPKGRPVGEGADTAIWLALLSDDGPTGGFFRNRESIPW